MLLDCSCLGHDACKESGIETEVVNSQILGEKKKRKKKVNTTAFPLSLAQYVYAFIHLLTRKGVGILLFGFTIKPGFYCMKHPFLVMSKLFTYSASLSRALRTLTSQSRKNY